MKNLQLNYKRSRATNKDLINFSSNDYLGLSKNPELKQLSLDSYGAGASQFVSGYSESQEKTEKYIAKTLGFENAILFSNGYMANLGVITALAKIHNHLYLDYESHASMIDGCLLSKIKFKRYPHGQAKGSQKDTLLLSESVFSMSGDYIKPDSLIQSKHESTLILDDAHGFGVTHRSLPKGIDLLILPCGKALGAYGALVLGRQDLLEHIERHARTLMYTTALPAIFSEAILINFKRLMSDDCLQEKLQNNRMLFESQLKTKIILPSRSAIYQWPMASISKGMEIINYFKEYEIHLYMMTPPTVKKPMIRITLSATHTPSDIKKLTDMINELT